MGEKWRSNGGRGVHTRAIDLLNAIYLACFAIIMVMIISRGMMLIIRGLLLSCLLYFVG